MQSWSLNQFHQSRLLDREIHVTTLRFNKFTPGATMVPAGPSGTTADVVFTSKDIAHLLIEALPMEAITGEVIEYLMQALSFHKKGFEVGPSVEQRKIKGRVTRRYERPELTLEAE